jgi:hypothetical protein
MPTLRLDAVLVCQGLGSKGVQQQKTCLEQSDMLVIIYPFSLLIKKIRKLLYDPICKCVGHFKCLVLDLIEGCDIRIIFFGYPENCFIFGHTQMFMQHVHQD